MFDLSFACISSTGNVRDHNEDNFCFFGNYLKSDHGDSQLFIHHCSTDERPFVCVFDGMGGERFGEIASFISAKYFAETIDHIDCSEDSIYQLFNDLNKIILHICETNNLYSIGTTATVLNFENDEAWFSNLGDSPGFIIRDDSIIEVCEMHTDEKIYGDIEGRKPKLTQYLGLKSDYEILEPSIRSVRVCTNDTLLICSDGLTDTVDKEEIKKIVNELPLEDAIKKLNEKALANGGIDNITIIMCRVEEKQV